jgi:putative glycosyltransferase (TIGR04348 family)
MLRPRCRVIVQSEWRGERADALVALHAFRSAASVVAFHAQGKPLAVVLTGTDLYRDLPAKAEARHSLDVASRLVVLQETAMQSLRAEWRAKCEVIFQSAPTIAHRGASGGTLRCIAVGHLRIEKDPLTLLRAFGKLPADLPIRLRHVGAPLDAHLGRAARELARSDSRYRYLGALPHGITRAAIASADLLIHPSFMEGGANVVVETVTSGGAVVASRIDGNVGMLGQDYPGYFPAGDADALAEILVRCARERKLRGLLQTACRARRPLFHPRTEQRAVQNLVSGMLA